MGPGGARKEYAASHHLFNTVETAFRIAVRIDDERRSRKTVSITPERFSPFPPEGIPRRRRPINGHRRRSPSAIVNSEWVAVALNVPSSMMLTVEKHEAEVAGLFTRKR